MPMQSGQCWGDQRVKYLTEPIEGMDVLVTGAGRGLGRGIACFLGQVGGWLQSLIMRLSLKGSRCRRYKGILGSTLCR